MNALRLAACVVLAATAIAEPSGAAAALTLNVEYTALPYVIANTGSTSPASLSMPGSSPQVIANGADLGTVGPGQTLQFVVWIEGASPSSGGNLTVRGPGLATPRPVVAMRRGESTVYGAVFPVSVPAGNDGITFNWDGGQNHLVTQPFSTQVVAIPQQAIANLQCGCGSATGACKTAAFGASQTLVCTVGLFAEGGGWGAALWRPGAPAGNVSFALPGNPSQNVGNTAGATFAAVSTTTSLSAGSYSITATRWGGRQNSTATATLQVAQGFGL